MNKQTLLLFGLIAGLVNIIGWFVLDGIFQQDEFDFGLGEILGYSAMLIALSTVFFGVKRYRDNQLGGRISFVQAFLNGLIIVLIASTIYVIGWEIYYPNFASDFGERYTEHLVSSLEEQGLNQEEIASKKEEMAVWMEKYESPLYRIPMTLLEIFPLGLLVTVISALVLKRK